MVFILVTSVVVIVILGTKGIIVEQVRAYCLGILCRFEYRFHLCKEELGWRLSSNVTRRWHKFEVGERGLG